MTKKEIEKRFNEIWDKKVGARGMSKTIKGEFVRCIGRLEHQAGNNGLCNDVSYEISFINNFLSEEEKESINDFRWGFIEYKKESARDVFYRDAFKNGKYEEFLAILLELKKIAIEKICLKK